MTRRLITLAAVGALVWLLLKMSSQGPGAARAEAAFMLGFVLLSAALLGEIVEHATLPRITGYILAGVLFGPFLSNLLTDRVLGSLGLFNEMAYAFIGLAAGAELRLPVLRGRLRSIALLITLTAAVVTLGTGAFMFAAVSLGALQGTFEPLQALAIAGVAGVIAAARSPSSAIAIISETRARGPFAETILGVSVAMDVVVICLFSVTMAFGRLAFAPHEGLDLLFILTLIGEIGASVVLGVVLGAAMVWYLERRGPHVPLVILGLCFVVYRFSEIFGRWTEQTSHLGVHLEPLLICAAAGFVIQNRSSQGDHLVAAMERVSLPVYVLFFAMAGARLDLDALRSTWAVALTVVACRVVMINIGTRLATALAGDPPPFRRYCWMGFVTQAGLSLALIAQLEGGLGGHGARLATLLVAVVAVNQVVGPAAFKAALERVGETRARPLARRSRA